MEQIQQSQIIEVSKNDVSVKGDNLLIRYHGKEYSFLLNQISTLLAVATQPAREHFIVSPGGYGIHWPEVDEDLSIGGLIKEFYGH